MPASLLLPVLYVGSYLALVKHQSYDRGDGYGWLIYYRYFGESARPFFWPLEKIDRALRPDP